jgi:hypothetical protein
MRPNYAEGAQRYQWGKNSPYVFERIMCTLNGAARAGKSAIAQTIITLGSGSPGTTTTTHPPFREPTMSGGGVHELWDAIT